MPNHCENDLYITGTIQEVSRCLEGIKASPDDPCQRAESPIDFNRIIPMPEGFRGLVAGSQEECHRALFGSLDVFSMDLPAVPASELEGEYTEARRRALAEHCRRTGQTPAEAEANAKRYEDNLRTHGHLTWYGWCNENWNTKWNAYECHGPETKMLRNGRVKSKVTFQTAWSPPIPVIRRLSELFPAVSVTLKYFEAGMGFAGTYTVRAGVVKRNEDKAYSGPRGG